MKDFFKDYLRRFLIGAAAVVLFAAVAVIAVLVAWLVVKDGESPLFYLVAFGVLVVVTPLLGALAKE